MKNIFKVFIAIILTLTFSACETGKDADKLTIYTTNYAQKFILSSLGKDNVNAYSVYDNRDLYIAGSDDGFIYETYDPNSYTFEEHKDKLEKVLNADLFIYNGKSDNDRRVLGEIVNADKDEELPIFDTTENAKRSLVQTTLSLSYNGKSVDSELLELLETDKDMEMFWLSPIEMMNVTDEIYEKLLELLPNHQDELKKNYDDLMYDLTDLYATIEDVDSNHLNNMFVSDTVNLNILDIHYIENIYLDHTENKLYKDYESNTEYVAEINKYIAINQSSAITTTNQSSQNYFDLLEVQSVDDFNNGRGFFEIIRENYELLDRILD